ncbi:MAG: hypothetical protein KDB65_07155 [Calditrichaeota bacterium]|nr:hypothetical protein [Calditrichota bacterium]MCB9369626.1 hypothetical protein [Calditrichota bacterium]
MIREEYLTAAGAYFERLMLAVQDLPDDRLLLPLLNDTVSPRDLFADLNTRAEKTIRALELLYQGIDPEEEQPHVETKLQEPKRVLSNFRIAHSTVIAALERISDSRFGENGDLPEWMLHNYLTPLEEAVPKLEAWSKDLKSRGQAGPTGLPVIQ